MQQDSSLMAQDQQEQRSAGGAGTRRGAAGSRMQDQDLHDAGLKNPSTVTSRDQGHRDLLWIQRFWREHTSARLKENPPRSIHRRRRRA